MFVFVFVFVVEGAMITDDDVLNVRLCACVCVSILLVLADMSVSGTLNGL